MRAQHAVDRGTLAGRGEPDGNPVRRRGSAPGRGAAPGPRRALAAVARQAHEEPRTHQQGAGEPDREEQCTEAEVARDPDADRVEAGELRRPANPRAPEAVEEAAERHQEVE